MAKRRPHISHIAAQKKVNPFDQIYSNLKRKGAAQPHSKPVKRETARVKSMQTRLQTLLPEYNSRKKSNIFRDRRIGRKRSAEDAMAARFQRQRQIFAEETNKFTLPDEELTHLGQTLADYERDVGLDSDPAEDENNEEAEELFDSKPRTQKEVLADIIARSKLEKLQKSRELDETEELINKADEDWKSVASSLISADKHEDILKHNREMKTYTSLVVDLSTEKRAVASDPLKSQAEIAHVESMRKARMELEADEPIESNHISADALTHMKKKIINKTKISYDIDGNFIDPEKNLKLKSILRKPSSEKLGDAEKSDLEDRDLNDLVNEYSGSEYSMSSNDESVSSVSSKDDRSKFKKSSHGKSLIKVPIYFEAFATTFQSLSDVEQCDYLSESIEQLKPKQNFVGNKPDLLRLFSHLITYICSTETSLLKLFKHVHSIALTYEEEARDAILAVLESATAISVNAFLLFISIYPIESKFLHSVMSPVSHILSQNILQFRPNENIGVLYLKAFILFHMHLSSQFVVPEVLTVCHFLFSLVLSECNQSDRSSWFEKHYSRLQGSLSDALESPLHIDDDPSMLDVYELILSQSLSSSLLVFLTCTLCQKCLEIYTNLSACYVLFAKIDKVIQKLPISDATPPLLKDSIRTLKMSFYLQRTKSLPLMKTISRPAPLKMFEPRFEEIVSDSKVRPIGPSRQLKRKLHSEMRGAIKEIKKDSQFLQSVKLKEEIKKDNIRKQKVKELYSSLAEQAGEIKKIKKRKFRLK